MRYTKVGLGLQQILLSFLPILKANNQVLEEQRKIKKVMMECIRKFYQEHTSEPKALRIDVDLARNAARGAEEKAASVEGTLSEMEKSLKERIDKEDKRWKRTQRMFLDESSDEEKQMLKKKKKKKEKGDHPR